MLQVKDFNPGFMPRNIVPLQAACDLSNRDPAGTDSTRRLQDISQHDAKRFSSRPSFVLYDLASTV